MRAYVHADVARAFATLRGPKESRARRSEQQLVEERAPPEPTVRGVVGRGRVARTEEHAWAGSGCWGSLHASAATPEAMRIYRQGKGSVIAMDGHGVTDHTDWGPMPADASLSGGFNLVIFPNLIVLRSQIRTVRPIAVDRTEILTSVVRLEGASEEVNLQRMRDQEFEFGAAGTFFADDLDIFERTQQGLSSSAVDWLVFSRGMEREEMRGGYMHGGMSDETQHRGMYQNWKRWMSAGTGASLAAE